MMKLFIRAHDLGVKGETAIIHELDRHGLAGVQLVAYKCLDDVAYAPNAITKERAEQFRDVFENAGKTIPLIGAYFNPVHPDEAKIEKGVAVFKDYLSLARHFGGHIVGSETGSYHGDKWIYHPMNRTEEALDRVVRTFSELCQCAEEHGVFLGMEGAFGHVCYDVKTLDRAVKTIGSEHIRIIFDLYNYLDSANGSNFSKLYDILEEGLQTFGERICVFHIKDCTVDPDGSLKQCGVGKGVFDYRRMISEIRKVCPDAKLVLEGTTGEDIAPAAAYLRQFI